MSTHALYVAAAYALSAIGLGGMVAWVLFDYRGRRRDLAALEASGIRRRSRAEADKPA